MLKMVLVFPLAVSSMVTSLKVLEMLQAITTRLPLGADTSASVHLGSSQTCEWAFREAARRRRIQRILGHGPVDVTG